MKDKLLKLLSTEHFISGEKLATSINVSRTAIWKQIKSLKNLGYQIESKKNKGYRLVCNPDIPIPEEILKNLDTQIIGKKIIYFKEISSTNSYAKKIIDKKTPEGTVIIADVQTEGRGRKNRFWVSPTGGLWFSIILYPNIPPQHGMLVTMTASISVAQAIKQIADINPVIKWPNDVLINGKKVCGILTEIDAEMDKINYSIIGIGVNVNNKIEKNLEKIATSLNQEKGLDVSRLKLIQSILKNFDENYMELKKGNIQRIRKLWFSYANIINKKIRVTGENEVNSGVVVDVDESGCLILDTAHGKLRIVSGDVEFL
jgi:BirA family transcriptional regulator, biotin operon repressor / biotin---[acetyl-CoA-carboxylase] ligase